MADKVSKLLDFTIDEQFNVNFSAEVELILCAAAPICVYIFYQIFISRKFKSFEIDEAEIGIGNQKVTAPK